MPSAWSVLKEEIRKGRKAMLSNIYFNHWALLSEFLHQKGAIFILFEIEVAERHFITSACWMLRILYLLLCYSLGFSKACHRGKWMAAARMSNKRLLPLSFPFSRYSIVTFSSHSTLINLNSAAHRPFLHTN